MIRRPLVVLALLYGCGDNLTGTPLDQLDAEADRVRCERLVRCGLFADDGSCDGFFRLRPDLDLTAAIAAGVVRYDGASASQCHDALATISCDTSARDARIQPRACTQMFSGTLDDDAPCSLDEECSSGTCSIPVCPELCCTGTCREVRPIAKVDEPCELDLDCVPDTFCGKDLACHPLVAEGGLCDDDRECDYHLGCIGPSDLMAGNCRALPLVGESCPYLRCAELGAVCDASHVCVAVGLPGAPCTSGDDCSPVARCDADAGVCTEVPRLGEACTFACAGESFCDVMGSQTCVAPRADTEPCFSDFECASLYCAEGPAFDACAERPLCF
ncbi:MAG: Tryptophan synthase alpha chain [Deltaproteobacteria bacterium]|nr:Tryptophan synthase alpha chain [Deltaproteobacteria bacterium]